MIWASIATPPSPLKQHEWFPAMTRGIPIESTDPKIEGASQSSGLLVVAVDDCSKPGEYRFQLSDSSLAIAA
jgi:hypothetical protein